MPPTSGNADQGPILFGWPHPPMRAVPSKHRFLPVSALAERMGIADRSPDWGRRRRVSELIAEGLMPFPQHPPFIDQHIQPSPYRTPDNHRRSLHLRFRVFRPNPGRAVRFDPGDPELHPVTRNGSMRAPEGIRTPNLLIRRQVSPDCPPLNSCPPPEIR